MTARTDADRLLAAWLDATRPTRAPDHVLAGARARLASTSRRPGWRIPDRWTWRHEARLRLAVRTVVVAAVVASILASLIVVAGLIGSPTPAPPFGLARPGLIAVDTGEGIVVLRADGTDRRVLVPATDHGVSPTWSRDGLWLAYWSRSEKANAWALVVVDSVGGRRMVLNEGITLREREAALNQPSNIAWSPDSHRIAYAADVARSGAETSIFVATLGRSGAAQLTDPALRGIDPAWAPDGSTIAFQSAATGTIHVVRPDGSGERQLSDLANTFLWPDWSPDGRLVATNAATDTDAEIFVISADGKSAQNVSRDPSEEFSPSWSPDGSRLAWARIPRDGSEVRAHVVVADPTGRQVLEIRVPADLAPPVWSPDGTRIYSYQIAPDGTFNSIVVVDPAGVAPPMLLPADGSIGNGNWQRLP